MDTVALDKKIQEAANVLTTLQAERRMLDVEHPVYSLSMVGYVMLAKKSNDRISTIVSLKHTFDLSLGDSKKLVDILW